MLRLTLGAGILATVMLAVACSSGPSTSGGADGHVLAGRRRRELLGQHRRAARRRPRRGHEHHRQPRRRPARLRADRRRRRARSPPPTSCSSTASATTRGRRSSSTRTQPTVRRVLDVGELVGVDGRRQPAPLVLPGDVERVDRRAARPTTTARPRQRDATSTQRRTPSRRRASRRTTRPSPTIKTTYAGTPVGASESIVALLAPALGLDLRHARRFLRAISEGTDPTARTRRPIDQQIAGRQIKVYVYNSQNATPDVQAQVDAAKAEGIPVATDHRDADARPARRSRTGRRAQLDALARRAREGDRTMSVQRRRRPRPRLRGASRVAVGGRTLWSGVDLTRRAGRVRRGARAERRREVHAAQGDPRPAAAERRAASRCSAGEPGDAERAHRLPAAAAQLRRRAAHARRRRRAARPRRRPLGRAAARGRAVERARREPTTARVDEVIELVGAQRVRRPADRPALRRRAAAAADRPGARVAARGCCCSTSRSTASTCPTRARSRRWSRGSAATTASTVLMVAHDVNPILSYLDRVVYLAGGGVAAGPPARGHHRPRR